MIYRFTSCNSDIGLKNLILPDRQSSIPDSKNSSGVDDFLLFMVAFMVETGPLSPLPYVEISLSIITNRDVVGRAGVHSKESFLATPKYICLFMV